MIPKLSAPARHFVLFCFEDRKKERKTTFVQANRHIRIASYRGFPFVVSGAGVVMVFSTLLQCKTICWSMCLKFQGGLPANTFEQAILVFGLVKW